MADRSTAEISEIMRRVRSHGTAAEVQLGKELRALGLRVRRGTRYPGKPDFVFVKERIALFVDGDFWHGGQWSRRGHLSLEEQFAGRPNRDYWIRKIRGNMRRDARVTFELLKKGWRVVRLWESEIRRGGAMEKVRAVLDGRGQCLGLGTGEVVVVSNGDDELGRVLDEEGWPVNFVSLDDLSRGLKERGDILGRLTLVAVSFCGIGCRRVETQLGCWKTLTGALKRADERPPFVLIEAPAGVVEAGAGALLIEMRNLARLGYGLDTLEIPVRSGAATRRRLFVLGQRRDVVAPKDDGARVEHPYRPTRVRKLVEAGKGIRWTLRRLPVPETNLSREGAIRWITRQYLGPILVESLHAAPLGGSDSTAPGEP